MPKTAVTGSLLALPLTREGAMPLYRQAFEALREAILSGRLPGGTRLPSTRAMACDFGLSRNTVLQVFELLRDEGLVEARTGAGTFVAGPCPPLRATAAASLADQPPRSLSQRGRGLVASATGEVSERPTPFMPDMPDLRAFPIRTWLRLLNETSGRLTGQILVEASNAGYAPLRQAIARHLGGARGMACTPAQVVVTTGSQQGLDLVCRMLLDPGDAVWIEEPGYVGARSVVAGNGGLVCPVPVDGAGMQVEAGLARHPPPRLVLVSPARHYPLGGRLAEARRSQLVEIARSAGGWILEDDYDHEFSGLARPALFAEDPGRRTITMGTFSKILLPSFRLGYLVVPADLAPAFARARAVVDRHASLIEQMVLAEFMERGLFASHVRRMRALYAARGARLAADLGAMFGPGPWAETPLGTHLVLPFRTGAGDRALAREMAASGLVTRPLSPYYAGETPREGLLLGFSAFDDDERALGLRRLARFRDSIAARLERAPRP